MEVVLDNIIVYSIVFALVGIIFFFYIRLSKKKSRETTQKIEKAKEFGIHEPVSLHPVVDTETCIGSGACIAACPEKDILGIANGQAYTINASRCVGHGACFMPVLYRQSLCASEQKKEVLISHTSAGILNQIFPEFL